MKQSAAGRRRCPHCGASVDSNEQNCWICGAELNASAPGAGRKPSAATHAPAAQPKPEPEPDAKPVAAPSPKTDLPNTEPDAAATNAAPKAQPKPAAPQGVTRGPAKPSPGALTGTIKPRTYPKMSAPRALSDRRDQRGWLVVIPLLAVLASFIYYSDPFKLRASPAANGLDVSPTLPVMTVVVLQPEPTQPTPVASSTPAPTPTHTDTPALTSTPTASAAPTELPSNTPPASATPAAGKASVTTATPRPPTASPSATATVPTATRRPPSVTPTATLVPGPGPNGTWVVARGDTCARIASQAGISVEALVLANALQSNCFLRAGQVLIIPTPGPATLSAPATQTAFPTLTATLAPAPARATATRTVTPLPTVGPPATQTPAATTAAANGQRNYTVKAGDTCFGISRAENVAVEDLIRINNLDSRCFLSVGQTLVLP